MAEPCQVREPVVVVVAGVAGSGKSTLGRALARALHAPLLDLDTLTNPLLDRLAGTLLPGHWLAGEHADAVREGRYAALLATASEVLESTGRLVLVAPFTRELAGGPEWVRLCEAVAPAPVRVAQLVGSDALFDRRRRMRAADRDRHRPAGPGTVPAAIPVVPVDATLDTVTQLRRLERALGLGTPDGQAPDPSAAGPAAADPPAADPA